MIKLNFNKKSIPELASWHSVILYFSVNKYIQKKKERKKSGGLLTFSEGIEKDHCCKMG